MEKLKFKLNTCDGVLTLSGKSPMDAILNKKLDDKSFSEAYNIITNTYKGKLVEFIEN